MVPRRPRRILLVRMDGVGDALALTPLVAALRDAGHTVGAVLSTNNRDAFARRAFSHVHLLERIPWPRHDSTPATYRRALVEARSCAYDVALIPSEEPEAYRFARHAGIGERVGFVTGIEKPLKTVWAAASLTRWVVRSASARNHYEHESETLFRLARGLHAEPRPTKDVRRLRPLVVEDDLPAHGRVAVQLTRKLWGLGVSPDALRAALHAVAQTYPTIAVAAAKESAEARALAVACDLELQITETMDAWKRVLGGALAVVTPDSGAAHVAGMTGVGCVDLFAQGADAQGDVRRWYPWASPRSWPIVVTRRIADRLAEHVVAGVQYVAGGGA